MCAMVIYCEANTFIKEMLIMAVKKIFLENPYLTEIESKVKRVN